MTPSRPSSDAARAAVWTGILGAAKHIGEHAPVPIRERPVVVQIRQGNTDTPLYSIGTGLCELNVPQFMPSQHSVFAAEIAWPAAWHDAAARNDTDATPVLEDMVVPYVTALHAHAGATPCVLVGYSFHASMAFEIAHQLLEKGSQVEMLMLLDAPAEYLRRHEIAWKYMRETWMPGAGKRAEICRIASRNLAVHRALDARGSRGIAQAPLHRERVARSGRADHEARYTRPPDSLAADEVALRQFAAFV